MNGVSFTPPLPQLAPWVLNLTVRPVRAQEFPEEYHFLLLWMEWILRKPNFLKTLLGRSAPGGITERDKVVATAIIQWLGTGIGVCFLKRKPSTYVKTWQEQYQLPKDRLGTLIVLLDTQGIAGKPHVRERDLNPISERDKAVALRVIKWLCE